MKRRILAITILLICSATASFAGGPAFVAGAGYNPGVEGQPLIWANNSVQYFTDQGNLSPILSGAQADTLVATAFSAWTSISGVSLSTTQGGHLAEDVNGSNIETDGDGNVTAPADIAPSATGTPVGIVYDYDGTVTDALLGEGAGESAECFTDAVYGGPDNFSPAGNIAHALVVINGVCATTNAQLPDVQYRLVRVLGRTLGLGWSQANVNVLTRNPVPTSDDYVGFPMMHYSDPVSCVPISVCYPNPAVPKMDDIDSIAKLYPASQNPQASGRVWGGVYFTDASGIALQQMQGVNVVARLMVSGQPSRQYVVTSVSGFLFCGNAGNIIDGYVDGNGLPFDRWGSSDTSLEGFFDLGQLMIPNGQNLAEYQLSVEALDPDWSRGVEPYAPYQVTPSGVFAPVVVTVTNGSNAERDILMLQDELAVTHPGSGSTYATPAVLPAGGAWGSWISGYGGSDWFQFTAQANRTASVSVTALNEAGQPTETKLLPVIGIWQLSDESGDPAPSSTPSAFNSPTFGMSLLDAQFNTTGTYRVGVADYRGDGRPDYFYQASLLYSDNLTPARLSLAGGVTILNGTGFSPQLQVTAGGNNANMFSASANQIQVEMPSMSQDGPATVQVTNPVTGAFSQMIGAPTYGASSTDLLLLLQGGETATPVGAQAASPIRVRVVAADGVTPVSGATLAWNSNNGLQFSVCGGSVSCSVLSDQAGESFSWVTPTATGQSTITIALAPASYSPAQMQQATVLATSTTLDLAALIPTRWIAQGATIAVPLTVEALDLGVPKANVPINFAITKGTATLSSSAATTNSAGLASITANLTNQNADVQVSACVAPSNAPCQTFTLFSTSASLQRLEIVSGSSQTVLPGQAFQPLVMRVTDGSLAANPVMGVNVSFATTLSRLSPGQGGQQDGESLGGGTGTPVILGSSQALLVTAQDGTASIVPSAGNVGPCDVFIAVSAGASTVQFQMESLAAIVTGTPQNPIVKAPDEPRQIRFGEQPSPQQSAPAMLFAVPQGAQNIDPSADSSSNATPESSADDSASGQGTSTPPTPEVNDKNVSPPKEELPKEDLKSETKSTKQEKNDKKEMIPENQPTPTAKEQAIPAAEAATSKWFGNDKRSCQVLASDGPVY